MTSSLRLVPIVMLAAACGSASKAAPTAPASTTVQLDVGPGEVATEPAAIIEIRRAEPLVWQVSGTRADGTAPPKGRFSVAGATLTEAAVGDDGAVTFFEYRRG